MRERKRERERERKRKRERERSCPNHHFCNVIVLLMIFIFMLLKVLFYIGVCSLFPILLGLFLPLLQKNCDEILIVFSSISLQGCETSKFNKDQKDCYCQKDECDPFSAAMRIEHGWLMFLLLLCGVVMTH